MPYQAPINSYYDSWGKGPLQLPGITPSVIGAYGSLTNFGPTWGTAQSAPLAQKALPSTPAGSPLNTSVGGPFGSLPRTTASSSGYGLGLVQPNATGFQGYGGGPGAENSFSTMFNVKSPEIDSATTGLLGSYNSIAGSPIKQTYLDRLKESEGAARANYDAETPTVSDTYSGKLAADLRALSQGQYDSEKAAADFAVAEALMPAKSADIRMGGQAGRNSGSYTDRIAIGAVTPIRLKLASDMANREAANFRDVRANQLQLLGAANARLDQFNQRALMPLQFQQQQLGAEAALLSPISQLQQSNRFYGVSSPLTGVSQGYGVPAYGGGGNAPMPYVPNYNPFAPRGGGPSIMPVTGGGYGGGGYGMGGMSAPVETPMARALAAQNTIRAQQAAGLSNYIQSNNGMYPTAFTPNDYSAVGPAPGYGYDTGLVQGDGLWNDYGWGD